MFIWPNGDVTGSVRWDELARLVGERPDVSEFFPLDAPGKEGWVRLEMLLAEHVERTQPADESAGDEPAADESTVEPEPPRRGPGRPRKEA